MKIKLKTKFFASVLFVLFVFLYNLNSYIITRSSSKEAIFINVNWIINNLIDYGDPPVKLEEIFPYIDSNQYYNYFPEGLKYRISKDNKYELEEYSSCWISLFRKGRLISSSSSDPMYENGELVFRH